MAGRLAAALALPADFVVVAAGSIRCGATQLCHRAVGQPGKRLGVLAYAVKALGVDRAAVPPLRRGEAHALLWTAAAPQRLHNAALGAALLRDAVALAGNAARVAAGKLGVAAAVVGLALGGVNLVCGAADARAGAVYRAAVALDSPLSSRAF